MLTIDKVRTLKNELEEVSKTCDEILKYQTRKRLFNNEHDISDARVARTFTPSEYYKFRYFDCYLELNKDLKGYYIYCENYYPKNPDLVKMKSTSSNTYRIGRYNSFEDIEHYFSDFVLDLLHQKSSPDNNLFYIY